MPAIDANVGMKIHTIIKGGYRLWSNITIIPQENFVQNPPGKTVDMTHIYLIRNFGLVKILSSFNEFGDPLRIEIGQGQVILEKGFFTFESGHAQVK
jgi:hypothetical protein